MPTLRLPAVFRSYTAGKVEVTVQGTTVGEVMEDLTRQYPGLRPYMFGPSGELRSFVHLFQNGEDILGREGVNTPVQENDTLRLIPSAAGG